CMQLFGLIFCVAATALLIPRDTEDRILYTILCKPVPRFDYLAGKAVGVLALLLVMLLMMDGLMSALLYLREGSLTAEMQLALQHQGIAPEEMGPYLEQIHAAGNTWDTQRAVLVMFLGYGVLTTLTLLFSCFTSGTIVSMIFGLGAYFVGMFQGQLFTAITATGQEGTTPFMQNLQLVVSLLLPDFSLFTVADTAAAGTPLGWAMVGSLALIAAAYMLIHLLIAAWIFAHKEF
ncbi:MAG: ABC transporter permease subunit, partial [Akkermansia sp.]|nr:ABC transporter permease subunit [Akkermansia sp.]